MKRNCSGCYGSGEVLGMGMIQSHCHQCNGRGYHDMPDNEIEYLAEKQNELSGNSGQLSKSQQKRLKAQKYERQET